LENTRDRPGAFEGIGDAPLTFAYADVDDYVDGPPQTSERELSSVALAHRGAQVDKPATLALLSPPS
jgi:hypothetical protein